MQYALFYIDFFVNNIQKNHHLTALNGDFIIVCITFLIRPFIGLSPFLRAYRNRCSPYSGVCQCPLSGFLHLYVFWYSGIYFVIDMSQCPLTGFFHLYDKFHTLDKLDKFRVNAIYRAFSISTRAEVANHGYALEECQCPLSGFLHFY